MYYSFIVFIKSRIRSIPAEYHTLRIRMLSFQRLDNIPTIVNLQVHCLDEAGNEIFLATNSANVYFDMNTQTSVFKDLVIASYIPYHANKFKELQIEFGDLGNFLIFSGQCKKLLRYNHVTMVKIRNALRENVKHIKITLADRKETKKLKNRLIDGRVDRKAFPSNEENGLLYTFLFQEQKEKREKINLWNHKMN